jgi:hypothetical protein
MTQLEGDEVDDQVDGLWSDLRALAVLSEDKGGQAVTH